MDTYLRMAHQEQEAVKNWTSASVRERIRWGKRALWIGLFCLRLLEKANVGSLALCSIAASLYDVLSDLSGECAKHLDNAGLVEDDAAIDLSPLNKFL